MTKFTVRLESGTIGTVIPFYVLSVGMNILIHLQDENGMPITEKGPVVEILEQVEV